MVAIWDSNKCNNSRKQFTLDNRPCTKQFIKVLAVSWINKDRRTQTKIVTGNLLNLVSIAKFRWNNYFFFQYWKSNSKRNSGNQGRDFKCEFCQVFLNSQKQLDQHNSSPKHIMTKNSVSKLLNPPVPGYPSMPQANYTGMAVHGQATKRPKFTPNAQR